MELCSKLSASLDGRRVWGRMDTCTCMAESLRCSPQTTTTLLIDLLQYKVRSLKRRKRDLFSQRNEVFTVSEARPCCCHQHSLWTHVAPCTPGTPQHKRRPCMPRQPFESQGFPGGSAGKESACNAGGPSSIPG